MIDLKQFKRTFNAILVVISPFSRKIAMEGLTSKTPQVVAQAFKRILTRRPKPTIVSTDFGQEFLSAFNSMLETEGIAHRYKEKKAILNYLDHEQFITKISRISL